MYIQLARFSAQAKKAEAGGNNFDALIRNCSYLRNNIPALTGLGLNSAAALKRVAHNICPTYFGHN
ncbi:MAG: hypothetical protein ACI861_000203 [Paracoccaceae bacterium]|jgi:hypothetical protein